MDDKVGSQTNSVNQKVKKGTKAVDLLFILAVAVIILLTIYFRIPMLHFYGFYEPDGYFHYSVIRAAVDNGFSIAQQLPTSGWPPTCVSYPPCHTAIPDHEAFGLYWVTLIPYFFLQFAGVSYYDIMRLVPVFFGILDVLLTYFMARYWSRNRFFGLLAMLLVALNMGNAARTSALIYRGDGFVTPFLLGVLIVTIALFRTTDRRKRYEYAALAAVLLALCNLVWNGGPFAVAVYVFAFVLALVFGFTYKREDLLAGSAYMLIVLAVWYLLVGLFRQLGWIVAQTFTGVYFPMLLAFLAIGWYLAHRMMKSGHVSALRMPGTATGRFALSIIAIFVAFAVIYAVIPGFVEQIFVTNGFYINSAFASTIQELQPPNYTFLFASFNFQNFTNPMSILMIIATYFPPSLVILFWLILLALFIPYFFMHIEHEDGDGWLGGKAVWRFEFNETTLILVSYFALTAYLQMNAIRFNSLVSVPISIFSAYTVYWLVMYLKRYRIAYYTSFVLVVLLIVFMVQTDMGYISNLSPADQVNPQFLQALSWMHNNTPSNSVVLTLWPDGSVVEGVANRTTVTDSVESQNAAKGDLFAAWLYNSSTNPGFLLANYTGAPNYLLVRQAWMVETGGIFTEAGINGSSQGYGYNPFTSVSEHANATSQVLQFFGSGGLEEDTVITNSNTTGRTIASYLRFNNGIQPFEYVGFYNVLTGNWSMIKQTAFNVTNNETFLITYSPLASPGKYVNVTGAYMLGPSLASSNMVKFLFQCNSIGCAWDNNAASLKLVYINQDTKIFRIAYNATNSSVAAAVAAYPRT
ncbi:MAG: hypothetical protein M1286_00305 [Candidatus Marsarchaeota archaeon]|nr:hypothetical protein [Candidatus Marsarchaeota archaeon]